MIEILAPAGNFECAQAAISNGANAVYLGLNAFSARQSADNFDETAFRAIVKSARLRGVKVYVAMNTLVKDEELQAFEENLLFAWQEGADALILQDIFLGKAIHEKYPQIVLHLSTQAGVCNTDGARFAKECGFSRVILARETPLSEIEKITKIIETEVFIQGALCTCFSGQCYFSSFVGGNSGNRGRCKQPCRKLYAYDRNGNEEKSYALSLSDLSVGEDIRKLQNAGVVSFKIEGRMRRAEYVASAVRYYRAIVDGAEEKLVLSALSDLKRAYNRGNYTKGLAFGQDKRFLSPIVQGHLGEKVGVVKVINGNYLVESAFSAKQGDAFKILREGKEIGGAIYLKTQGKSFVISSKTRLKNGDSVFVTTDTQATARVLQAQKRGEIRLSLFFQEGQLPKAVYEDMQIVGEKPLQTAQNRPLTQNELRDCFLKTDGLEADILFSDICVEGNIFLPKSELNAFRRTVYERVLSRIAGKREEIALQPFTAYRLQGKNAKTAVIADDFTGVQTDIAVYKPKDMRAPLPKSFQEGNFEKYLYYPAFATADDITALQSLAKEVDGIYAENYAGAYFAEQNRLKLFAGTGFNLFNRVSVGELLKLPYLAYYALSKECNERELSALVSEKAFALSSGNIKIMDLCYCPFGKRCFECDKKEIYRLEDENGRVFPVRRYVSADGACRFEVYNCADLLGKGAEGAGRLLDLTLVTNKAQAVQAQESEELQKGVYQNRTSGHCKRGVL